MDTAGASLPAPASPSAEPQKLLAAFQSWRGGAPTPSLAPTTAPTSLALHSALPTPAAASTSASALRLDGRLGRLEHRTGELVGSVKGFGEETKRLSRRADVADQRLLEVQQRLEASLQDSLAEALVSIERRLAAGEQLHQLQSLQHLQVALEGRVGRLEAVAADKSPQHLQAALDGRVACLEAASSPVVQRLAEPDVHLVHAHRAIADVQAKLHELAEAHCATMEATDMAHARVDEMEAVQGSTVPTVSRHDDLGARGREDDEDEDEAALTAALLERRLQRVELDFANMAAEVAHLVNSSGRDSGWAASQQRLAVSQDGFRTRLDGQDRVLQQAERRQRDWQESFQRQLHQTSAGLDLLSKEVGEGGAAGMEDIRHALGRILSWVPELQGQIEDVSSRLNDLTLKRHHAVANDAPHPAENSTAGPTI